MLRREVGALRVAGAEGQLAPLAAQRQGDAVAGRQAPYLEGERVEGPVGDEVDLHRRRSEEPQPLALRQEGLTPADEADVALRYAEVARHIAQRQLERQEAKGHGAHVHLQRRLGPRHAERRQHQRGKEQSGDAVAGRHQRARADARHQEEEGRVDVDEVAVADEAAAALPVPGDLQQEEELSLIHI